MSTSDVYPQSANQSFVSQDQQLTGSGEFDYKPIPMTAAISLALAIFGISGLLTIVGLGFSMLGIIFALLALGKIKKSDGELGGKFLARAGLFSSILFLMGGIGSHAYLYATELPDGHMRVNFPGEISALGFTESEEGELAVPQEVIDKFIDKKEKHFLSYQDGCL